MRWSDFKSKLLAKVTECQNLTLFPKIMIIKIPLAAYPMQAVIIYKMGTNRLSCISEG